MGDRAGSVAVVGSGVLRQELAAGLRDLGVAATMVDVGADFDPAFEAVEAADGRLDGVVWASAEPDLGTPRQFAKVDSTEWLALVEQPLRSFVGFLQAGHRRLSGRGGRIVALVPTIAMDGAASLVPWATVAEGQRALVKSAARVWGADGITVNCVALPAALMARPPAGATLGRPGLQQAALADPAVRTDVAAVVASLCAPAAAAVTGATIAVDGGRWMPP
jgi:NAD(P)-dependent dehydrogenase (short-subunit alcohol dehydrogenase family)